MSLTPGAAFGPYEIVAPLAYRGVLLAPWLAHVLTALVIASVVLALGWESGSLPW